MEHDNHNEARLSQIERTLARTVANLETVGSDLGRLAQSMETLRETVANSSKTQWNVLGTWVGVVMAIGAAVITPQMSDIKSLGQEISRQRTVIQENAVHINKLEERLAGHQETIGSQVVRSREELDWVWDLLHSRFGYRDPGSQRKEPNRHQ